MDKSGINFPRRKSIRLKDYDYTSEGAYFVTIATHKRINLLGELINGEINLTELGQIAYDQWHQLSKRFQNIELDAFAVMPDHIHGIIFITNNSPTGDSNSEPHVNHPKKPTIGNIIGAYKSLVARECLKIYKARNEVMGKLWQRNNYEHIIRDDKELVKIRLYVEGNPMTKG